ncbi:MAG: hypothetical protein U5N58_07830 [Actinomycetota bacterium]|nr:hypothetical protein [Actinomycetota bacterium]
MVFNIGSVYELIRGIREKNKRVKDNSWGIPFQGRQEPMEVSGS